MVAANLVPRANSAIKMAGGLQRTKQLFSEHVRWKGHDRVIEKVELVSCEEGKFLYKMIVGDEHLNKGGSLHGGLTATLLDTLTTFTLRMMPPRVPGVSVDMNISFLRPAKVGDEITINTQVVKLGQTLAFLTADLLNKDGQFIARGTHTKYVGHGSTLLVYTKSKY